MSNNSFNDSRRISLSNLGPVLWTEPSTGMWQKYVMLFGSLFLLAMGILFSVYAVDLVRKSWQPATDPVVWIMIVGIAVFILFGLFLGYCGFNFRKQVGASFHRNGIAIGDGDARKAMSYSELELFQIVLNPDRDQKPNYGYLAVRASISLFALSPAGIGYVLGKAFLAPTYSELTFKSRDGKPSWVRLSRSEHEALAPVLPKSSTPTLR